MNSLLSSTCGYVVNNLGQRASAHYAYDPVRNAIGEVTNSVGSPVISQYGYVRNGIEMRQPTV